MYNLYCRVYQFIYKNVSRFLDWSEPELLEGENSLHKVPGILQQEGFNKVLVVTDKGISELGLMDEMLQGLRELKINYVIYDGTVPNPTIENVEEALRLYYSNECEALIAFGGGSPMDCAKAVAAKIARPTKNLSQLKGQLRVRKKTPPIIAIPTTSGTGSEGTIVSVVSNTHTNEKYAINDPVLRPKHAILDPLLTVNLPPHITSSTGMDALTHAIEAYIGKSNTSNTKKYSEETVKLVFENLYEAYTNGTNITARTNMQKASYLGGLAFTRAYVGYVHAIAHTLGGFYNFPHGLANAIILPHVLTYHGEAVHKPLAKLADIAGVTETSDSDEIKTKKFIEAIKELNQSMDIPEKIKGINEKDVPSMVERALQEANPLYPVPKILRKKDLFKLYSLISE